MNTRERERKLILLEGSAWDSWQLEGTPFGIEKIGPRDYVVFRLWGRERVYLSVTRDKGFTSREFSQLYLEEKAREYEKSIVVAQE